MKRIHLLLAVGIAVFALSRGCSSDSTNSPSHPPNGDQGRLRVFVSDAPGDIDAVFITYSSIQAHVDNSWISVTTKPRTVNLMEWNNGGSLMVCDTVIGAGHYTQIRLMVTDATVVVDGVPYPLVIPSASQTGLKLNHEFDVRSGSSYDVLIDFDVQHSVHRTGNGRWMMKPVVRCVPLALTGSISGAIAPPRAGVVATAYVHGQFDSASVITSSAADPATGRFKLAFLPAGVYSVRVVDLLGLVYVGMAVEVRAGMDNDIGLVVLQKRSGS